MGTRLAWHGNIGLGTRRAYPTFEVLVNLISLRSYQKDYFVFTIKTNHLPRGGSVTEES